MVARSRWTPCPYGLKKGLRDRFGAYVPPLMEALGLVEAAHNAKNNRVQRSLLLACLQLREGMRPHQCSRRYSLRSAVIGSMRVARRVGARPAINATSKSTPETASSVAGSVGATSKSDF